MWPRAVQARRRWPAALRRIPLSAGIPGIPRFSLGYLLDIIYNRDLWMHRLDLARATGLPFQTGDHARHIVAQAARDLALTWTAAPVALELTGPGPRLVADRRQRADRGRPGRGHRMDARHVWPRRQP